MTTAPGFRALAVIVAVVLAAGVTSTVVGVAVYVTAAVLLAAGVGWLAVAMLRREQRIRARLADPRSEHHPARPTLAAAGTTSGVA